jgi:hypothetical protein
MKKLILVAGLLIAPALLCFAQTNSPASATPPLPAPPPQMQAQPKPALPPGSMHSNTNSLPNPMTFSSSSPETTAMSRIERRLKPQAPPDGNGLPPKTAEAFRPEITQIGRAQLYTPIGTAVARKNPLCLLDPRLFVISW